MSKPVDITQEVWDAAFEAMPPVVRRGASESPVTMALWLGIARAIMAAKAEERDACEAIAVGKARDWAANRSGTLDAFRSAGYQGAAQGAVEIATAIRKRRENSQ